MKTPTITVTSLFSVRGQSSNRIDPIYVRCSYGLYVKVGWTFWCTAPLYKFSLGATGIQVAKTYNFFPPTKFFGTARQNLLTEIVIFIECDCEGQTYTKVRSLVKVAWKYFMTLYVTKHFLNDFQRFIWNFSCLNFVCCVNILQNSLMNFAKFGGFL